MTRLCDSLKRNFLLTTIIPFISILFNIVLTVYIVIDNAKSYDKYQKRDSYIIIHVNNSNSDYYIVKASLNNTNNCSSDGLFTFDVKTVYRNIISKEPGQNLLFVSVYWVSTAVAVFINIFDIILAIYQVIKDRRNYERFEGESCMGKLIASIGSQFLKKGSFLFPTYFISVFNYNQLCLSYHSKASLFILHHTYISIFMSFYSMAYLIIWTFACWDTRRDHHGETIVWIKCIEVLSCGSDRISLVFFIFICLAVVPAGIYGTFVWILSLIEDVLIKKAILICFNMMLGIFHDLIIHCK